MIASGRQMLLSFALPKVSVSPINSNVALKPLSGSVVTNKRGGLSNVFLRLDELGVMMVASLSIEISGAGWIGGISCPLGGGASRSPTINPGGAGRKVDVSG